jgi:hypothetical protein
MRFDGAQRRRLVSVGGAVLLAAVGLGFLGVGAARAAGPEAVPCPGNLLVNPGFEEGFARGARAEEMLPHGWSSWFETVPGVNGINYPPSYVLRRALAGDDGVGGRRVALGAWSVEQSTSDATHVGGLWQRVAVPPGSQLLARAWAYSWASRGDREAISEPPGTFAVSVGIDPLGGQDAKRASVRWSEPITVTDAWLPLVVEAMAERDTATVFTRGDALRIQRNNVARWDGLCLRVLGPAGEPTATHTRAPWPTRTPLTPVPTATEDPLIAQSRTAGLRAGIAAAATERASAMGRAPDPGATLAAAATRIARGGSLDASAPPVDGAPPPLPEPEPPSRAARAWASFVEQSGWGAFALAAMIGSWLFGLSLRGEGS